METTSLVNAARTLVERARVAPHGRSARTVHGGHDRVLRHTVVALRAGESLHEHPSSREATLQVLAGRVRVTAGTQVLDADAGTLLTVPAEEHTLDAIEDSAVLLTVGLARRAPEPAAAPHDGRPAYSWQEDGE
jgi:quercetin dioxygenase-like cupin family protein